ncbi:M36 family metallopeptidase [Actinosynnema sp. NPDC047251]|uniref:Peptidase, M36 family n=1 Tax=Saccharothrix espanaensis (strain ATCC 51144 / DSM 44229 / JCM 9112 / NBRC 15066 / NRRL 15764) TaxID=1179773 RepID=K0JQL0_SACES|nr:M36 family metallopeptidase [Saccharothrix espanaensis]CCH29675.1 Peptidase, M36 family [Saccharothrix espanaensis DSM 44229]
MRRQALRRVTALAATGVLVISPLAVGTASGAPATPPGAAPGVIGASAVQGDTHGDGDVDNRPGATPPTDRQVALAGDRGTTVRWNRYGAPATLVPRADVQRRDAGQDPVAVARGYLEDNRDLFGLAAGAPAAMQVVVSRPMGQGSYVMLRQDFGGTPALLDGLATFGIRDGVVVYLSSTLSPTRADPEPATLAPDRALAAATADAGLANAATSRVRLGAVPMPDGPARAAYQVVLVGGDESHPAGYTSYVDARTGALLVREDLVDHDSDNPEWDVFPANPPADYSTRDNRVTWCLVKVRGCERAVRTADRGAAWDADATGSSKTSAGNSGRATEKWDDLAGGTVGTRTAAASPSREYTYPWTNQWHEKRCDPAVFDTPQQNDIDAALTNLFAMHNRMHDWSYHLGFTEETWNMQADNGTHGGLGGDAERGNAQAGGRVGGAPPGFPSRNNANQITPPDGVAPTTNMYLWQPVPGAFYGPCVDGDYDMSVIGHEYGHAISGRLIAGPDSGWSGAQAGAMNESHSDLFAVEYLYEYGFVPRGDTRYVVGGYVTGDAKSGIRNYDLSRSPLNYSNVAYDLVGAQVHADGEIWSATSFDVRKAMIERYGNGTPARQRACADGRQPVEECPGNRRWIQQVFDSLLLNASGAVSYVDMRDATIAANEVRFGGADVPLLWNAFARRGLGQGAASNGPNDQDPTPSFASPHARNATLRLAPNDAKTPVRLYVGDYEARSTPVADTDPATPLPDTVQLAPGSYRFVVAGVGYGSTRLRRTVEPGERDTIRPPSTRNLASKALGATAAGDGVNLDKLIDDTEASGWAALGAPVAGRSVRVDLAGTEPQRVGRVQLSALLRPAIDPDADPGTQSRFTAVRQFEVLACTSASGANCDSAASYRKVFTSPANAFPANGPRPTASDLTLRSFHIPPTKATHLMVRVLTNQCTGAPEYAGSQHNDPRSTSDCATGNPAAAQAVRIAEFQAFRN